MDKLPEPDYIYKAQVLRVVDGDTYEMRVDVGFRFEAHMPLRLAHVDAPERYTKAGKAVTQLVSDMLGSLPASVVVKTYKPEDPEDKYGRYLAEVYFMGQKVAQGVIDLAQYLLANGLAAPYEGGKRP